MQDWNAFSVLLIPHADSTDLECIYPIYFCSLRSKMCMTSWLANKVLLQRYKHVNDHVYATSFNTFVFRIEAKGFLQFLLHYVLHLYYLCCVDCWNILYISMAYEPLKLRKNKVWYCKENVYVLHWTFKIKMGCFLFLASICNSIFHYEFLVFFYQSCLCSYWVLTWL